MNRVAVITDSNSGITQSEAKELGIFVIPMPFFVNEKILFEDIDLGQEEFYQILKEDTNVSTSQPTPADVLELWENTLNDFDSIVHIPMSSGLSNACETAMALAQDFDGHVQVVNNQRISVTQRQAVYDAMALAQHGRSAAQIKEILEREAKSSSIYIMVDTLKYLKRGGRITPAAAMIGTVLNLKPVLQIQGEKLDAYAKVRGQKQAKKTMLDAMRKDFEERFADYSSRGEMLLHVAHTANWENANKFAEEISEAFPGIPVNIDCLSLSVSCHIGPGSLAIACSRKAPLE